MTTATIAYDLTDHEIENGHLADLAKAAGYESLRTHLNDHNAWNLTVGEIEAALQEQIDTI